MTLGWWTQTPLRFSRSQTPCQGWQNHSHRENRVTSAVWGLRVFYYSQVTVYQVYSTIASWDKVPFVLVSGSHPLWCFENNAPFHSGQITGLVLTTKEALYAAIWTVPPVGTCSRLFSIQDLNFALLTGQRADVRSAKSTRTKQTSPQTRPFWAKCLERNSSIHQQLRPAITTGENTPVCSSQYTLGLRPQGDSCEVYSGTERKGGVSTVCLDRTQR